MDPVSFSLSRELKKSYSFLNEYAVVLYLMGLTLDTLAYICNTRLKKTIHKMLNLQARSRDVHGEGLRELSLFSNGHASRQNAGPCNLDQKCCYHI